GIAVDSSGNAYATGYFNNAATFGRTNFVDDGGNNEIFIAKLSSSGSWQWVVKAGGTGEDYGKGIAIDANGFVHLTGEFSGTGDFRGDTLTSAGGSDVFVWRTFPGPIITSVSPDDSHPDGNVTATITGDSFQWLNQTFSKNITVTNSGNSTLNNHVITVEDPLYNESGLVGSWHFDESSGTIIDSGGYGNNATTYGNPTYGVDGIDALAMNFDGVDDAIMVDDDDSLDMGTSDFTISFWIKIDDAAGSGHRIFRKGMADGFLSVGYKENEWNAYAGSGTHSLKFNQAPVEDEWTHIVFRRETNYTGDSNKIQLSFSINGVEETSQIVSSAPYNISNSQELVIGAQKGDSESAPSGGWIDASLDELKFHKRFMSDSEVTSLYQGGLFNGDAMRNYWDAGFSDSNGSTLPHTMPADGEFQIEIPQIPANSSIAITIEYGQEILTNPNINTTNQSSDMTNISISIGSATTNLGVTFGNTASSHVEYIDENTINVTVPPNLIGAVNLTITDSSGYSHTLVDGFTYYGISSLSPSYGVPSGGTNVTVTGAGFDDFTQYRTPITVSNPTASTITNSAVNVSLPIYNVTGLVGSWHFDESSGTVVDTSGNGNNASASGGPTYGVDGIDASAMEFDGTDDNLTVADDNSLDFGTGEFSISVWVKIDSADSYATKILRKGHSNGCNECIILQFYEDKWMGYAGGSNNVLFEESPVEDKWTHVVLTREVIGSTNHKLHLYLDGELKETSNFGSTAPVDVTNSDDLWIGSWAYESDWFDGSMDELKMYDRLMTSAEILAQYQGGNAMRNYWDVQFKNENGEVLNHSMDSDGTFQVEISSVAASSSQTIYA
ncbi:MAG TPA: hypothetical protein EYG33_08145, partial [Candidatus Poseidoniales archaeon]|nr:hypothetical protein [Candidatus Poseidoniales archaeon]